LLSLLTVDDVQEKAQYHSACITIICWSGKKIIVLIITLQLKMSRNMILHSKNS
jgi:hypothetical protein